MPKGDGPDGSTVCRDAFKARRRGKAIEFELALLGANDHVPIAWNKKSTQPVARLDRADALCRPDVPYLDLVCARVRMVVSQAGSPEG